MVEKYSIRTDLALEEKEKFESDHVEIEGVVLNEEYDEENEIRMTTVLIETEKGAKAMGKPVGSYITIEAPRMAVPDEDYHQEISMRLKESVEEMVKKRKSKNVLVVGLGNRQVTPDALGPYVADNLQITRHIIKEYGRYASGKDGACSVSAIVPGVMGQTGMETVEVIRGVVAETKPDLLIVVDALAARNSRRLNRTIQVSDTGISPGSGVGNHRNAINEKTVGVPVIAIGVPTVVDAATIVGDTMDNLLHALESSEALKSTAQRIQSYTAAEKYELIKELIAPHLNGMYVTPKDIDDTVKRISYTISEALNALFEEPEKEAEDQKEKS